MISFSMDEPKILAETLAEQYATAILHEYFGDELFIGPVIEPIVHEMAAMNYQDVDDPEYYGAVIAIEGVPQVVINTHQPLRKRYYCVAQELWHVLIVAGKIRETSLYDIDRVCVEDHFAGALMLPEILVRRFWQATSRQGTSEPEDFLFRLADLSSVSYTIVARRMRELKLTRLPKEWTLRTEDDWIMRRQARGLLASPLDVAKTHVGFSDLSKFVLEDLDTGRITVDEAISMLTYANPEKAKSLWEGRLQQMSAVMDADDK